MIGWFAEGKAQANMIPRPLSSAAAAAIGIIMMTAVARADDTIVIGFGGGLTGALGFYDGLTRNGAQMAIDEINAAGGIAGRYKIDFQVKDVLSEASAAAAAGREFVAAGAKVLIAPCGLDAAISFGQPAQQAQIPIIAPCASTPTLGATVGDFMFQVYPADNLQAAAMAKFARQQGYGTAYILMSPDTPFTQKLPLYFEEAFEKMGGKVVSEGSYMLGQQDFGAQTTSIKNLSPPPDVIMMGASEPEFPIFLSQLRAAGIDTPVLGSDAIESPTTLALGAVAEGVVYISAGYPAAGNGLEKFYGDYVAKFGGDVKTDVGIHAATAYESVKLIEVAIARAGATDGVAVRDALGGIADFRGITGSRITLAGASRVALRDVAVIRIEKGAKTLLEMLRPDPAGVPTPH
jgi:branched-chain amino acid transport system substrate-binding protein